jgi:O-antigen/teichoic acid export membrane protein
LPILFLAPFFSVQEIGLYGLAYKAIAHGTSLISGNVHNIVKADMAAKMNIKLIWPSYSKMLILLAAIGGITSIILAFFAQKIFSILFGNNWEMSGYIAKLLIPLVFASLIRGMGNAALRVLEKTKYMLVFSICSVALRLLALSAGYLYTKSFTSSILIYSIVTCVVILSGEIYLCLCIKTHDRAFAIV